MGKCFVCGSLYLEVITVFYDWRNLVFILRDLLGLQATEDDYLCEECYAMLINMCYQSNLETSESPEDVRIVFREQPYDLVTPVIVVQSEPKSDEELTYNSNEVTEWIENPEWIQNPELLEPFDTDLRLERIECTDLILNGKISMRDPLRIFKDWFNAALASEGILEPNAVCASTMNASGKLLSRRALVKEVTKEDVTFFTSYGRQKAEEFAGHRRIALNFYWGPLRRTVKIEGYAIKIYEEKSSECFPECPRLSQIGSLASNQSRRSRISQRKKVRRSDRWLGPYENVPIPNWEGFLIRPDLIEFWQGVTDRLHSRIRFRKFTDPKTVEGSFLHQGDDGWVYECLAP